MASAVSDTLTITSVQAREARSEEQRLNSSHSRASRMPSSA